MLSYMWSKKTIQCERTIFSINGLGKLDIHKQKNKVEPLPNTNIYAKTIHKNYI